MKSECGVRRYNPICSQPHSWTFTAICEPRCASLEEFESSLKKSLSEEELCKSVAEWKDGIETASKATFRSTSGSSVLLLTLMNNTMRGLDDLSAWVLSRNVVLS